MAGFAWAEAAEGGLGCVEVFCAVVVVLSAS